MWKYRLAYLNLETILWRNMDQINMHLAEKKDTNMVSKSLVIITYQLYHLIPRFTKFSPKKSSFLQV